MVQPISSPAGDTGPEDEGHLRALTQSIYQLARQVKQLHIKDGVDTATLAVLWRIREDGAARPSDLAAELCLDLSTISRHVRTLDQGGYLARTSDPEDRRACRLTVTPAGQQLIAAAHERRLAAIAAVTRDWTPADRLTLTAMLTRLAGDLAGHSAVQHAVQPGAGAPLPPGAPPVGPLPPVGPPQGQTQPYPPPPKPAHPQPQAQAQP